MRSMARHRATRGEIFLALVLALAALGPAAATAGVQAAGTSSAAELGPALQQIIDNKRKSINIPGVSAAVIFADGSRWSGASGRAALSADAPATPETPFVAGSITKTFVAATILRLAEEGKLSLNDPLATWLPGYPNSQNISLRQLMSHTSGVFNHFEHRDYNHLVFDQPAHAWQPQEILDTFGRAPYFAPGAGYHYSNTGFVLLGMVIEIVTGTPVGHHLAGTFLGPLGLARTWFQGDGPPPADSAHGYLLKSSGVFREWSDATGYRPTRSAATVAWSAGGIVATAGDLATWARALYGGSALSAGSLSEMTDFGRYPQGNYGLGTRRRTMDGHQMHGHAGSLRGFMAGMWHLPSDNTTVVVLTNRGRIDITPIIDALLRRVLSDTTAPSVPLGLSPLPRSNRYVDVSWAPSTDNVPGTIRYRVFRDGTAIGTRQTTLTFIDRPSVGRHSYQVRSIDAFGNKSARSPAVSAFAYR